MPRWPTASAAVQKPHGPWPRAAALLAQIESLQAELAEARRMAAGHRADFERERERCDRLAADLGAIAVRMARPWWRRMAG
jgi:hypothetical protein